MVCITHGCCNLIVLVACPMDSDSNGGGGGGPVTATVTTAATGNITINVAKAGIQSTDTKYWWAAYEAGTTVPGTGAAQIGLIKAGGGTTAAVGQVDATKVTSGIALTATDKTDGLKISGKITPTPTTTDKYDIYVVLSGDDVDSARLLSKKGVAAAAPVADTKAPDGSFTALDGTTAGEIEVTLTNDGTDADDITTASYVIVLGPALSPAPDYDTLNGKTVAVSPSAGDVVAKADFAVPIAADADNAKTATLSASTQYTVYVIIADGETTPNTAVIITVAGHTFTTKS